MTTKIINTPTGIASNQKYFLVCKDRRGGTESWIAMAVIRCAVPNTSKVLDEVVQLEMLRVYDEQAWPIQPQGSGSPGKPYADEPRIQVFEHHVIIRQSGGLDV